MAVGDRGRQQPRVGGLSGAYLRHVGGQARAVVADVDAPAARSRHDGDVGAAVTAAAGGEGGGALLAPRSDPFTRGRDAPQAGHVSALAGHRTPGLQRAECGGEKDEKTIRASLPHSRPIVASFSAHLHIPAPHLVVARVERLGHRHAPREEPSVRELWEDVHGLALPPDVAGADGSLEGGDLPPPGRGGVRAGRAVRGGEWGSGGGL